MQEGILQLGGLGRGEAESTGSHAPILYHL